MRHVILVGHDVSGSKKGERYITARGTVQAAPRHSEFPLAGEYSEASRKCRVVEKAVNAVVPYLCLTCAVPLPSRCENIYTHKIASSDNGKLRLLSSLVVH